MNYLQFFKPKNVAKFDEGGIFSNSDQQEEYEYLVKNGYSSEKAKAKILRDTTLDLIYHDENAKDYHDANSFEPEGIDSTGRTKSQSLEHVYQTQSDINETESKSKDVKGNANSGFQMPLAAVGEMANASLDAVEGVTMGDKNQSAQSQAIDAGVRGTSEALIKTGNPYALLAAGILETTNFATKAGGKNIPGHHVDIENSGYGNLGHQESEAGRIWDLGRTTDRKLAKRNEQARMALAAAEISGEQKFEQEARANSVDNVIQQNQIALAGGIDTSLLSAKNGAKLQRLEEYRKNPRVKKAKEGAKLKNVELSEEGNIVPTGDLHKNKHDIDLEHITSKGVPVITVDDDSVETFTEIKQQEDSIVQHAEIETGEVILNKSLTDYVEDLRKKWHDSEEKDSDILLEVGKRITKELLFNTTDEEHVIGKQEEKL